MQRPERLKKTLDEVMADKVRRDADQAERANRYVQARLQFDQRSRWSMVLVGAIGWWLLGLAFKGGWWCVFIGALAGLALATVVCRVRLGVFRGALVGAVVGAAAVVLEVALVTAVWRWTRYDTGLGEFSLLFMGFCSVGGAFVVGGVLGLMQDHFDHDHLLM